jgi:hypothetical protein
LQHGRIGFDVFVRRLMQNGAENGLHILLVNRITCDFLVTIATPPLQRGESGIAPAACHSSLALGMTPLFSVKVA